MIRSQNAKMFKNMLAKLLVAVMIISSVMTIGPGVSATAASKPAISKKEKSVLVGKKYNLDVDNKINNSTYQWKSSNKKVATVTSKGIVKGIKKGTVTITCTVTTPDDTYKLTSKVTIRKPATSFAISNKISALNAGQKFNFDRTLKPSSSNDKTTWTTSDSKIAAPNANGKFTALKVGTVTITGKTISGKTDAVTIEVVDKDGTVKTQAELEALLGSGVSLITLKTDEEATFTIPKGDYSNQKLVVDAPKADVTNKGVFKSVDIKQIKSSTWTEEAIGNVLHVSAPNASIIIANGASASISVENKDTKLSIVNNGTVSELILNANATVTISGTSTTSIPVTANVANAAITTSIPLTLTCNEKITLTVLAGAEATTVTVTSEAFIPTVLGTGSIKIVVGTGDNAVTRTVEASPVGSGGGSLGGGSSSGGSSGGGGSSTPITRTISQNADGVSYTLPVAYTALTKVVVKYGDLSLDVNTAILIELQDFLSAKETTINTWKNTTNTTKYNKVTVSGTAGELTKQVEFTVLPLVGRIYDVTVDETAGTVSITRKNSGITYTISKSDDNKTLTITNAPDDLSFVVTY